MSARCSMLQEWDVAHVDPSKEEPEASKTAKKKMVLFIGSLLSPEFP